MGTPQNEPMYTVTQVAELGLIPYHPETIRGLCKKGPKLGGLRSVKDGTNRNAKYMIPASAIEEWKTRKTYNPAA